MGKVDQSLEAILESFNIGYKNASTHKWEYKKAQGSRGHYSLLIKCPVCGTSCDVSLSWSHEKGLRIDEAWQVCSKFPGKWDVWLGHFGQDFDSEPHLMTCSETVMKKALS